MTLTNVKGHAVQADLDVPLVGYPGRRFGRRVRGGVWRNGWLGGFWRGIVRVGSDGQQASCLGVSKVE